MYNFINRIFYILNGIAKLWVSGFIQYSAICSGIWTNNWKINETRSCLAHESLEKLKWMVIESGN